MLPTSEKAPIYQIGNSNFIDVKQVDDRYEGRNLYITSYEKAKVGEYFIANQAPRKLLEIKENSDFPYGTKNSNGEMVYHHRTWSCRKIIATTDTSLKQSIDIFNGGKVGEASLPQLPELFIKKYIQKFNDGNGITEVMVEYRTCSAYEVGLLSVTQFTLKVNQTDNTITIQNTKDSWNREEVIQLIRTFDMMKGKDITTVEFDNWIEQNL